VTAPGEQYGAGCGSGASSAGRLRLVPVEEGPDRGQQPGRIVALHVVARVRDGDNRAVADQGRERGGLAGGGPVAGGAAEDEGGAGDGPGLGGQRPELFDQRRQARAGRGPASLRGWRLA